MASLSDRHPTCRWRDTNTLLLRYSAYHGMLAMTQPAPRPRGGANAIALCVIIALIAIAISVVL